MTDLTTEQRLKAAVADLREFLDELREMEEGLRLDLSTLELARITNELESLVKPSEPPKPVKEAVRLVHTCHYSEGNCPACNHRKHGPPDQGN